MIIPGYKFLFNNLSYVYDSRSSGCKTELEDDIAYSSTCISSLIFAKRSLTGKSNDYNIGSFLSILYSPNLPLPRAYSDCISTSTAMSTSSNMLRNKEAIIKDILE